MANPMSKTQTIVIPELGDFDSVPVIEILVSPGDKIDRETPLLTLESDKATMDVPASHAGTVSKILVSIGQEVKAGDAIVEVEVSAEQNSNEAAAPADTTTTQTKTEPGTRNPAENTKSSPESDEE